MLALLKSITSSAAAPSQGDLATAPGALASTDAGPEALQLPEVLSLVLQRLDHHSLTVAAPLVCKAWLAASKDQQLWTLRTDACLLAALRAGSSSAGGGSSGGGLQKSSSEGGSDGSSSLRRRTSLPQLHHAVYARNFLRNPCFVKRLNADYSQIFRRSSIGDVKSMEQRTLAWAVTENSESAQWESPPLGMRQDSTVPPAPLPYPSPSSRLVTAMLQAKLRRLLVPSASAASGEPTEEAAAGSCLATAQNWSEVVQVVDMVEELQSRGLDKHSAELALDSGLALGLSIWVGARQDCPAQFAVCLMLDDGKAEVRSFQTFVRRPSSHHFFSKRVQAVQGEWHRYCYLVRPVPKGFRRAIVLLRGKDRDSGEASNRQGASGAKFACAQLSFVHGDEVEAFGADACQTEWANHTIVRHSVIEDMAPWP